MNIFAPAKSDLSAETPEDNCALHYEFIRKWSEAYWGAILHSRDLRRRGYSQRAANAAAWQEFDIERSGIPSCH